MKVRIIKASKDTYWYSDKIGQEIEVKKELEDRYYLPNEEGGIPYILKTDCEVIPDTFIPFTFAAWDKDRSQKVFTSDGREVNQLTWFECEGDTFAGILDCVLETWNKEGNYYEKNEDCSDLFLEHTEKDYWVNVYKSEERPYTGGCFDTFQAAENFGKSNKDYIKTINFKA